MRPVATCAAVTSSRLDVLLPKRIHGPVDGAFASSRADASMCASPGVARSTAPSGWSSVRTGRARKSPARARETFCDTGSRAAAWPVTMGISAIPSGAADWSDAGGIGNPSKASFTLSADIAEPREPMEMIRLLTRGAVGEFLA